MKIDAIIYSYKNKNLKRVVDTLLENTKSEICVYVFDQNTIDRSSSFLDSRVIYEHIFWDDLQSPNEKRGDIVDKSEAEYILQISDDCIVGQGWDVPLLEFIKDKRIILSGVGKPKIFKRDEFSIGCTWGPGDDFSIVNYLDKNFMFSTNDVWNSIVYPYYLKYNGEEEKLSLDFFRSGVDIVSVPKNTYIDLGLRVIEKSYVPFSRDHNYNLVVTDLIKEDTSISDGFRRTRDSFLNFHGISPAGIVPLPYSTNDVSYDPYGLSFQDIDARKFIANTKAIY